MVSIFSPANRQKLNKIWKTNEDRFQIKNIVWSINKSHLNDVNIKIVSHQFSSVQLFA